MRLPHKLRSTIIVLLGLLASGGNSAFGAEESLIKGSQFHFRTGPLSGSYSGPVSGSVSVTLPVDLEYELFTGSKTAYTLRATLGHDQATSRMMYAYAGVGRRWYLSSTGMAFNADDGAGNSVSQQPKLRYYVGVDGGVSQVVVVTFGPVLQASSALIDVGGHAGAIYQLSRSIGVEAHLGYARGFGFSSVAVGAGIMKTFVGVSYYF